MDGLAAGSPHRHAVVAADALLQRMDPGPDVVGPLFRWVHRFGAGVPRGQVVGQHLAPVGQDARIHGLAQIVEQGQIGARVHVWQVGQFLAADAVFAGDGSAHVDAHGQDFPRQFLGAVQGVRFAAVVQNQRVQVAVAGMEHIGHPDSVACAQAVDELEGFAQPRAGHDTVLHDEVGAEPAHGRKGALAALPNQLPLGFRARRPDFMGTRIPKYGIQLHHLRLDLDGFALQLDNQDGGGLGVARLDTDFGGLDGEAVHDFDGAGQQAAGDDGGDRLAGGAQRMVGRQHRAVGGHQRQQAQGDLKRDPEPAFGTHEQARQIRSDAFKAVPAQLLHGAVRQHNLHAQDMVARHAVLETVRAAGVEGHVAPDGADRLAGRIRRVVEAVGRHGLGNIEVDDPRLHAANAVGRPNVQDAVQPVQGEYDAAGDGYGSAGQAGARTAGHARCSGFVAPAHGRHHLVRGINQHHGSRTFPECGQAVGFEGCALGRRVQDALRGHDGLEARDHLRLGQGRCPTLPDFGSRVLRVHADALAGLRSSTSRTRQAVS